MLPNATPSYRFGDLLALARRSWVEQVRASMTTAGFLGYRQTDALVLRLLVLHPWPIGGLGDVLHVTRQAARKLADGMVERGYAELKTDPEDARRTMVHLTRAGTSYARAVATAQDALNDQIRGRVTKAELAVADRVLRMVFPDDEARRRIDGIVSPPAGAGTPQGVRNQF